MDRLGSVRHHREAQTSRALKIDELKPAIRDLLAERFHLQIRRESKEVSVFALIASKGESKLQATKSDAANAPPSLYFTGARIVGRNANLTMLAEALQSMVLDRPVIDKAELAGNFDFDLIWKPDEDQFGGRGAALQTDGSAPSLFTAIQQQLGLKLDSQKAVIETIVIDRAEKPSQD